MDITISKDNLLKALNVTQSIVERKVTMPILSNLLLSVEGPYLKISATDLEITAVSKVSAEVRSSGSTTVNAKVFSDIVKELPDGDVSITLTEGERLEINCQSTRLRVIGVSADEYPSLPGIHFTPETEVKAAELADMINKSLYAVSVDETRFNLNGVCFSSQDSGKDKAIKLVATDGHRLSLITRKLSNFEVDEEVIVPRKGLGEMRRLLEGCADASVKIAINDGYFIIDTSNTKVSMRLVDGEFPDYKQVLPKDKGIIAVVNSSDLEQALRRAALMVTDKGKCVKLDFSENLLRISSSSSELGDSSEELEIEYDGEPLSIGFNARYLLDFASSLGESKALCMELHGALGPGKFYAQSDQSYVGIIMPMRLT